MAGTAFGKRTLGWLSASAVVCALTFAGCGGDDDDGGPGGGGGAAAGTSGGSAGGGGQASGGGQAGGGGQANGAGQAGGGGVMVPRGDERWQQAFAEVGFGVTKAGELECTTDAGALAASGLARVSAGGATIYVGFHQVSGDNQDPFAARVEGDRVAWCRYHENDGPDGRAVGLTWDGGPFAYVVYTVVGGGTDLEMPGWFRSYGGHAAIGGGNKKVGVVGRLDAATGALVA
ncbi:MAG TPA: hypothetical protein VFS00_26235, partial [Polyangiaceae bacterium]|nr:hypothetical protein [Polyangiaceae bacterium]